MNIRKLLLASTLSTSLVGGSAAAEQTSPFTGWYIGLNGGYGFGSGKATAQGSGTDLEGYSRNNDLGLKGLRGGLQAGYGHLFENRFYLGAELSADYSNTEGTVQEKDGAGGANLVNLQTKARRKDSFGAALHVGGLIQSMLAYFKVGVETARWNFTTTGGGTAAGAGIGNALQTNTKNKRLTALVVGVGAETMLSDHIKLGGEVTYSFYGKSPELKIQDPTAAEKVTTNYKPRVGDFRIRLSYIF